MKLTFWTERLLSSLTEGGGSAGDAHRHQTHGERQENRRHRRAPDRCAAATTVAARPFRRASRSRDGDRAGNKHEKQEHTNPALHQSRYGPNWTPRGLRPSEGSRHARAILYIMCIIEC